MGLHFRWLLVTALLPAWWGCGSSTGMPPAVPRFDQDLADLEQRLEDIDSRLGTLAHFTMQTGVGAIGYRSAAHGTAAHEECVQIDLGEPGPIDEIVIVPTIYRRFDSQLQADAFPEAFRVVAGTGEKASGTVIASFTADDHLLPRIAPVVIPCQIRASWVRVEGTTLSARAWDGRYALQLSEILVFRREDNIAFGRPVTASSSVDQEQTARHSRFLVDGFVPYLMDATAGEQGIDFLLELSGEEPLSITIALGGVQRLSRIHLHAIGISDNVPQAQQSDFGIPKRMLIEAAIKPDFSDATALVDYHRASILDTGPIMVHSFPETEARFVRLTVTEPWTPMGEGNPLFGIAEVECFAAGRNVALGCPVAMRGGGRDEPPRHRRLAAITDGRNFYGTVLPIRQWLEELSQRHDLEVARPTLQAAIQARYQRQATLVRWLGGLAVLLGGLIAVSIVAERLLRQRAIARTREQIAADLHDELGANLHAIALYGDLAQANHDNLERLRLLLDQMRALTERSGVAARSCVNMLESRGLYEGLAADMRRTATRLLADIDHHLDIENEDLLASLPQRQQVGMALFYKECLTNIIRHSGATRVVTRLVATPRALHLVVTDNGHGLAAGPRGRLGSHPVPDSLRRRARLLGAKVAARDGPESGTCISLTLSTSPWWKPASWM
jgi:signal transduction histidine kinase